MRTCGDAPGTRTVASEVVWVEVGLYEDVSRVSSLSSFLSWCLVADVNRQCCMRAGPPREPSARTPPEYGQATSP